MKDVVKGAATTVIQQHPDDPLHKSYERLLEAGTKPNLARLTLARKLAAITLTRASVARLDEEHVDAARKNRYTALSA